MAPSCWFFWAWSMWPMLAVAVAGQQAEGCSGSGNTCGNLTISDPFWLTDWETGRSCGSPDFQVTCYDNIAWLRSTESIGGFTIINITYEEHSLRAIDQDKLDLVHSSSSCYYTTWNTSVKLVSSFQTSPTNLNLILYNCTMAAVAEVRQNGALVQTRMRCGNESRVFARVEGFYNETSSNAGYAVEGCEAIVVPVLGGANASNYEQLISGGFLLSWDGLHPVPLAGKFPHPSNNLSIKFLPRMSFRAFGFLSTH
uniref:Uncharacterized protein n=1 Tax=Avena sativa TaxID=4498 RepID=A0ACD5TR45_AVESA